MDFGPNIVAHVWSFADPNKDIPYRIARQGSSKKDGGKGFKWSCTCPSFVNRGGRTCKHLITMRQGVKDNTILSNTHYQISDYGLEVLKC
jgi:hypothetical protein